jgi:hypothetical protein
LANGVKKEHPTGKPSGAHARSPDEGTKNTIVEAGKAVREPLDEAVGEITDELFSELPDIAQKAAEQYADDARCTALQAWQRGSSNAAAATAGAGQVPRRARDAVEADLRQVLNKADGALESWYILDPSEFQRNLVFELCGFS